jgi:4-amino-4-deoxy-L-arabinose transferase-like glycosyltransferase
LRLEIEKDLNTFLFFIASYVDVFVVLILIAISSIVFFSNLGSAPMWAGDELIYFEWASHIVNSGDYLTPWAFGMECLWIGKPPLIIWLMSFSLRVFEQNFATRFWSALFGVLSIVLVFYIGKLLFNRIAGILSATILLTFSNFYAYARLGWLDVPLTFFLLGSIYFFMMSEKAKKEKQYAILSGIFFGLALMTKQIAALLIPIIIFFYLLFTRRNLRFLLRKPFVLIVGIGLLIFCQWVVLMTLRFGTDFWHIYFYYAIFQRTTTVLEYNSGGYLFYINHLISTENNFWLILLPFSVALSLTHAIFKHKKEHTLLLVYMAIVLGVFSISQTKLCWYIIPIFPAFALVLGNLLYQLFKRLRAWGFIPISALIIVLLVAPLVSTQAQLIPLAEKHWDYAGNAKVTSVASLSSVDKFPKIVTGGYFINESAKVADLNIWNFTGQAFDIFASNHLELNTTINCIATGDVNGDNQIEIVSVGTRDNGLHKVAQLVVWNDSTLALENKTEWFWGSDTTATAVAVGNLDNKNQLDIVTAGTFYNGSCTFALLSVWNGKDLSLEKTTCWHTFGNTTINSIAISDIDGNGLVEIIVGGYYFDGDKEISQITVWNSTLSLKMNKTYFLTRANARIALSLAIGDVDGDGSLEIVAGGYYYQNKSKVAQITVWNGKDLSFKTSTSWGWLNDERALVNSLTVSDYDGDGSAEIIAAGNYFNGTINCAQISVWSGSSLSVKTQTSWSSLNETQVNAITTSNSPYTGRVQILTGGSYNNGTSEIAQLVALYERGSALGISIETFALIVVLIAAICGGTAYYFIRKKHKRINTIERKEREKNGYTRSNLTNHRDVP